MAWILPALLTTHTCSSHDEPTWQYFHNAYKDPPPFHQSKMFVIAGMLCRTALADSQGGKTNIVPLIIQIGVSFQMQTSIYKLIPRTWGCCRQSPPAGKLFDVDISPKHDVMTSFSLHKWPWIPKSDGANLASGTIQWCTYMSLRQHTNGSNTLHLSNSMKSASTMMLWHHSHSTATHNT